ncbi:MAG: aminotransferase class I/II-fold pyridoxal phosphate-dependent enzyme, partial [Clostridia bacterium]|nr:aminotransferase class I/II-fold pyridoxal phosphate-dependent enzyme [Clostridia bacterium]
MIPISRRMDDIHSDIRGPLYFKALEMSDKGIPVLRLNTGNPAVFGFEMPESVRNALYMDPDAAVPYCDSRGMPEARRAICDYELGKGIKGLTPGDIFITNGVSEAAEMLCMALVNPGDEVLCPCPNYSLWSNSVYLAGGKPVFYVCDEQQKWNPDIADIKRKITSRTRALL